MSKKKHNKTFNKFNSVSNEAKMEEELEEKVENTDIPGEFELEDDEIQTIPEIKEEPFSIIETFDENDYLGWKKIEIEILRDRNGNCICIGSREFINKYISVIPVLTIPNRIFQFLRTEAIKISEQIKHVGSLNLEFAINLPEFDYRLLKFVCNSKDTLIEEASEYPMNKILDRVLIGELLDNIEEDGTYAYQEPILREILYSINGKYNVKANNLEKCIIKANCMSKDLGDYFIQEDLMDKEKDYIEAEMSKNNEEVFIVGAEAIRREMSVEKVCELTKIDKYFIGSIYKIIKVERELTLNYLNYRLIQKALNTGFTVKSIAFLSGKDEKEIERIISKNI